MSDSDDTDILLLIPPNYYINTAESQVHYLKRQQQQQRQHRDWQFECQPSRAASMPALVNAGMTYRYTHTNPNVLAAPPPPPAAGAAASAATTATYQFLPADKKDELNRINARLDRLTRDNVGGPGGVAGPSLTAEEAFAAPSDISTISTHTVQRGCRNRPSRELVHSTPKCGSSPPPPPQRTDEGLLLEIDQYFNEDGRERQLPGEGEWYHGHHHHRHHREQQHHFSNDDLCTRRRPADDEQAEQEIRRLSLDLMPPPSGQPQRADADNGLISLSEIWGRSNCNGGAGGGGPSTTAIPTAGLNHKQSAVACAAPTPATLKEEQLRRQHLEKAVRSLQARLLEYEQRVSVAIEVDRSKDAALAAAQNETQSVQQEAQQARDRLLHLEATHEEVNARLVTLQHDLHQVKGVASKLQEKNDQLEAERAGHGKQCNEWQQKVDSLEVALHACRRSEEYANMELNKLRDRYAKVDYEREKLQEDCSTLRQQKETLQALQQKQRQRADTLETQRSQLQETVKQYEQSEQSLKRKLEIQQKSLKAHYQQQLETVVAQKLREFQEQLDRTEEVLRSEARDRERFLAERAVKQLELMNEKSELELNLMQEKHNEEVELYRIQLANASKKIEELEAKLDVYKTKRADIAEKLHGVMETQWQKALAILTSPSQQQQQQQQQHHQHDSLDEASHHDHTQYYNNNNHNADTPKTSKVKRIPKENNLNAVSKHQRQQQQQQQQQQQHDEADDSIAEVAPSDRLQAYIELLLSKSPSDFQRLDEILALSKNAKLAAQSSRNDKSNRTGSRGSANKPPWKA